MGALLSESTDNGASPTALAKLQTEDKIALYGAIDRWPTLSLLPSQFLVCECGRPRLAHELVGTQRLGVGDCAEFRAPVELDSRRRRRG